MAFLYCVRHIYTKKYHKEDFYMKEVKQPKKPLIFYYLIVFIIIIVLNFIFVPWFAERSIEEVDYGTFISMTDDKKIDEVDIEAQSNVIYFTGKDDKKVYKTAMVSDENLTERLYKSGAKFSGQEIKQTSPILSFILSWIVPILIFTLLGRMLANQMMKHAGGGKNSMMFGMGKSNAKIYVNSTEGIKFTDVAGEDEAKENLTEIVEYLHNPGKYKEIGASMPKGILLVGPPGTGKTMLAKAVAGEANVPFFSMSGSEFVEMFVGMGASKVRDLFQQAKENDYVRAGTPLSDGATTPADILAIKGPTAVQEYIVNEVQDVYRLQGVKINDKHFEIIVRQMMRKVQIDEPGDTRFLEQQVVDKLEFMEENDRIWGKKVVVDAGDSQNMQAGQIVTARKLRDENSMLKRRDLKPVEVRDAVAATSTQILQGITRAALQTSSFMSAASFQETTKVLNEAAINGKIDKLEGMKENVICGHLIPAGTGQREFEKLIVGSKEEYDRILANKKTVLDYNEVE